MRRWQMDKVIFPFFDPLYLKAVLLDPSFGTMWLTHDVLVPENTKEAVSALIKGMLYNFTSTCQESRLLHKKNSIWYIVITWVLILN